MGKRDRDALDELVVRLDPDRIVDVTHPFAETISRYAMSVARERTIPYAYLDRPSDLPEEARGLRRLDGWDAAVRACSRFDRVLLTIGVNRLTRFTEAHPDGTVYARVIPRPDSVRRARESGVARERVIGLWPPVSTTINRALITTHDLEAIVSKDSGPDGGVPQKWEAARREGISLLLVERPDVDYRRCFQDVDSLMEWVSSPVTS